MEDGTRVKNIRPLAEGRGRVVPEQRQKPVYAYLDLEVDLARRELRVRGEPVHLGGRAFEVIEVLIQARGETVNKYDLMDRVWPGAVVEENTLQFHISAARKALGHNRGVLKTVFGKGYRLLGEWTLRDESATSPRDVTIRASTVSAGFRNNLPAAVFQLIGRDAAVKEVAASLSVHRIVTLTGPGGVGKTTLSLEVARSLSPDYEGDCVLVELASLSDPDLVPSAVATGLGQQLGGHISSRSVAQSIAQKKLLLVLDNCEHLINAAAGLAETLVRMCPRTSVLATSREPLHIEGEQVFAVPPLDVPPLDRDLSDALQHSAVQLFVARSGHVLNQAQQAENLAEIAAICRDLDGIPLAIEFAAARAVTLGVQHVAARLNDRFRLLSGGRRTALPRHQTLRATLDWSYELLSDNEKYLLRHLAVLPGGFTVEAAAAMAGGDESHAEIEERISSLVWKSLVTLAGTTSDPRWRLLETIRAYAFEKLAEHGEAEQAARRHAEFFRDLYAAGDNVQLVTLDDLARYTIEIDNVRAALDWAFSSGGNRGVGVGLTAAFAPVWLHLSLMAECRERVERARANLAAADGLSLRLKAQLLTVLGIVTVYTGATDAVSRGALTEALEIGQGLGDAEAQLQALYAIWIQRFNNDEHLAAQALAGRFAAIASSTGDAADTLVADRLLGSTEHYGGNQRKAQQHYNFCLSAIAHQAVADA